MYTFNVWSSGASFRETASLWASSLVLGHLAPQTRAADVTTQSTPATRAMVSTPAGRARLRPPDLRKITVDAGSPVGYLQFLGPRAADDVLHVPPVFDVRLLARRSISYRNNSGYDLTIDHLPAKMCPLRLLRCSKLHHRQRKGKMDRSHPPIVALHKYK